MGKLVLILILLPSIIFAQNANESVQLNEQGVAAVHAKNFVEAEELFLKALSADSNNLTAVFNLAGMYLTNEDSEKALKLLKSYAKTVPEDVDLQARLGDTYFSLKDTKLAKRHYLKAFKSRPDYPQLAGKLGALYSLENNLIEAENKFRTAVKNDPLNYDYSISLSSILLANGKSTEAITFAKKALQLQVTSDAYVALGTAYEIDSEFKKALIAFRRAQDLGGTQTGLKEKIAKLEELQEQNG